MELGEDGIYGYAFTNAEQAIEIELRQRVALATYVCPLEKIAKHHSIPVMDFEVERFLRRIPRGGWIIDVGGCWGWHWRNLHLTRPDVRIFIVDFVRANLLHARALLGDVVNQSIYLIHGDATNLKLPDATFDAYWSVQTLQHVVRFEEAVSEAKRVLKQGGVFANYSLNDPAAIRWLYSVLGRPYVSEGQVDGSYWLARASSAQKRAIERIFETKVSERLTEILYKPELHISFPGKRDSWVGHLDARCSGATGFFRYLARQRSFHCTKPFHCSAK
jgi:ubiquinone/menaquinone biosynthesis C-methylase UbiE